MRAWPDCRKFPIGTEDIDPVNPAQDRRFQAEVEARHPEQVQHGYAGDDAGEREGRGARGPGSARAGEREEGGFVTRLTQV